MSVLARQALEDFAHRLQKLRFLAGAPSLNRIVELSGARPLARSTISDKLNAKSLPEWEFVVAFVDACTANAGKIGVSVPAELADLGQWDAAHWELLRAVDRAHANERLAASVRAEMARRAVRADDPPVARPPVPGPRATLGPTVPHQMPAAVRNFAGRAYELGVLDALADEAAQAGQTVVISAIDGFAGVGKTAIAIYWAHRAADRFPDGQLYVNLRGFDPGGQATEPAEAVRRFLDALAVPADRIPAGLEAQAALYRSLLAGRRMLVVLDNARDCEQVRPLLPGGPGCLVLVTSRTRLTGLVTAEGAQPLTLGLFTAEEAREMLTRRLGHPRVAGQPAATDQIIASCAGLPLALSIVAARAAANPGFPLSAFADELRRARSRLEALDGSDPDTGLRAVFSWSYRGLAPRTARLFRLLGLHPGPDVSPAAAASLLGGPAEAEERACEPRRPGSDGPAEAEERACEPRRPGSAERALAELARAHLVVEHAPGRFSFHDLLRAYAGELATSVDSAATRHDARARLIDHYLHTAYAADRMLDPHRQPITLAEPRPAVTPEHVAGRRQALAWFTAERRVLLSAVSQAGASGLDTHALQLAWTLTTFLDRQGHWPDWAASQRVALDAAQRLADPSAQARAHRDLARAYAQLGRYEDAHVQLHRALELFGGCADRIGQAHTHLGIGWVLQRQDRHRDALRHAERSLELFQSEGYRGGQANALNNIGAYQIRLGLHGQALVSCREALAIHREVGDLRGQAETWHSLGYAHHHAEDQEQATACYRRALELFRELGDRYQEAAVLTHLGDARHAAGDHLVALEGWRDATAILDALGHADAHEVRTRLTHGRAAA